MKILDWHLAVLAFNELFHHAGVERTRPEQCQHRDQVFELGWPERRYQFAHAAALQLEDPDRVSAAKQLVRGRVVEGQSFHIDVDSPSVANPLHGLGDHRERFEAEEVELDEPDGVDVAIRILRQNGAILIHEQR
ncbi:hypothetical protein HRbin30_02071 [bacterium HR30]|nr:hypothetical protein HRbin30_02071 [bacterium HR30]